MDGGGLFHPLSIRIALTVTCRQPKQRLLLNSQSSEAHTMKLKVKLYAMVLLLPLSVVKGFS